MICILFLLFMVQSIWTIPLDQNPVSAQLHHLYKQFYVVSVNHFVWDHIFHRNDACVMATFTPIDNTSFFFHFSDFRREDDFQVFEGTMKGLDHYHDCFMMEDTKDIHKNRTLCFNAYDEDYHYLYITDIYNRTAFGLIDAIHNDSLVRIVSDMISESHDPVYTLSFDAFCHVI